MLAGSLLRKLSPLQLFDGLMRWDRARADIAPHLLHAGSTERTLSRGTCLLQVSRVARSVALLAGRPDFQRADPFR